jgi:hypothetical protein
MPTSNCQFPEAEQTEAGETECNDRLISVTAESHTHASLKSLNKMDSVVLREIEHFFISYNEVRGKKFRPKGYRGPTTAKRLIKKQTKNRKSAWKAIWAETHNQTGGWLSRQRKPYWTDDHITWLRHAVVWQLMAPSFSDDADSCLRHGRQCD